MLFQRKWCDDGDAYMRSRARPSLVAAQAWVNSIISDGRGSYPAPAFVTIGMPYSLQHQVRRHFSSSEVSRFPVNNVNEFKCAIFKYIANNNASYEALQIMIPPNENALMWMAQDLLSALVQVMVWRRQAPSRDLSDCWQITSYGVTKDTSFVREAAN